MFERHICFTVNVLVKFCNTNEREIQKEVSPMDAGQDVAIYSLFYELAEYLHAVHFNHACYMWYIRFLWSFKKKKIVIHLGHNEKGKNVFFSVGGVRGNVACKTYKYIPLFIFFVQLHEIWMLLCHVCHQHKCICSTSRLQSGQNRLCDLVLFSFCPPSYDWTQQFCNQDEKSVRIPVSYCVCNTISYLSSFFLIRSEHTPEVYAVTLCVHAHVYGASIQLCVNPRFMLNVFERPKKKQNCAVCKCEQAFRFLFVLLQVFFWVCVREKTQRIVWEKVFGRQKRKPNNKESQGNHK